MPILPTVMLLFPTIALLACLSCTATLMAGDAAPAGAEGRPGPKYGKAIYHRTFMARIKQGPIGILFLGDSITERLTTEGKDMLAKFSAYQPAVFGVGGEETGHLLYRLTTGEADIVPNPAVVVLLIGVNDISHKKSISAQAVAAGIKRNLEVIRTRLPESTVVLMSVLPFGRTPDAPIRKTVDACNALIKEYADGKQVVYLDVHRHLLDKDGNVPEELMPDALHPNAKGYAVWYEALWPVVGPILERGRR